MDEKLSVEELEDRWARTLAATQAAVARHPQAYRRLKRQVGAIVDGPVDIQAYFPTVEALVTLLTSLDPTGKGSIFDCFLRRITPSNIWQVRLLRLECADLLAHLEAFDGWRRDQRQLRRIK